MKDTILGLLKALLGSKKFTVLAVGLLTALGVKFGIGTESANQAAVMILGTAAAFAGVQGVADHGKEAAKVKLLSPHVNKADS